MHIYLTILAILSVFLSYPLNSAPLTITFDGYATDTVINNQYYSYGILFGDKFAATDPKFPSSPVAAFTHPSLNPYFLSTFIGFVTPLSAYPNFVPRHIYSASFDIGPFVAPGDVTITWYKTISSTTVIPIKTQSNTKAGIEHISFSSSEGFNLIDIESVEFHQPGTYPRLSIDNVTFDALGGGSCSTTVSASAEAAECPCGDERDDIIAEYKKTYPTSKGLKKPSYVPKCSDFTLAGVFDKITKYYLFGELSRGDGKCLKYSYIWAIIAPPLKAPASGIYGFDRMIERISIGSTKTLHPKVTSGYRNPKRNFSTDAGCASSTAANSAHMYGSAVDLSVTGTDKQRLITAAKWNKIAKNEALARFVENKKGFPCSYFSDSTPPSKRWRCVHADWQNASFGAIGPSQPFVPLKAGKFIAGGVAALAVGVVAEAAGADKPLSEEIPRLAASENWQDRARAFDELDLDLSRSFDLRSMSEAQRGAEPGQKKLEAQQQKLLRTLFQAEIAYQGDPPDDGIDEEENEYFLRLTDAVGMYGDEATIPMLFEEGVVASGALAHSAAARTGDNGVPLLAAKMRDRTSSTYSDYIGVACLMRRHGTVRQPENLKTLDGLLLTAAKAVDDLDRSFAATCLQWLPRATAVPILSTMSANDTSLRVRENAREALRALRSAEK